MPSSPLLKALGLNVSPNPLDLPPGSLTEANNVVVRRDNVVEPRRGNVVYDSGFGTSTDRAKQLITYKNRIITHYSNKLAFDSGNKTTDGLAIESDFAGTYSETQTGLRIKSIESNGNLYFTTSDGIKKISAVTAADFSTDTGFITSAGGVKAVDFTAEAIYSPGNIQGFLPTDSAVAYRIVWGTNDKNNNLILGTPSQRLEVFNPLLLTMIQDYIKVLGGLDNINQTGSLINDGDYVSSLSLPLNSSATDLYNNLLALTAKIDQDIIYANDTGSGVPLTISSVSLQGGICTITFTTTNVLDYFQIGDNINVTGFSNAPGLNAIQTITTVTTNSINFLTAATVNSVFPASAGAPGVDTTSDTIATVTAHGLSTNSPVTFNTTGSLPAPLVTGTTYYVLASGLTSTAFQVAATVGGAVIDLTTIGAGSHTVLSTNATGIVTGSQIESNNYRSITQPTAPNQPTVHSDLVALETYLQTILDNLQSSLSGVVSPTLVSEYLDNLAITTSANVQLTITIPEDITENYFVQIYRTAVDTASDTQSLVTDIDPGDEMALVYEAYPTAAELAASEMTVIDITPDDFRGANLYTNAATGEGILQSNDVPPFAKDINRFKNVIFYSNTRVRQKENLSLLGVTKLIADYNNGNIPELTITRTDGTFNTYRFIVGVAQQTQITVTSAATLDGAYFLINGSNNNTNYYVWFNTGSSTDPAIANRTGIQVPVNASDSDTVVATKLANAFLTFPAEFEALSSTNQVGVENVNPGYTDSPDAGTSGFTFVVTNSGTGEKVTQEINQVTTVADVTGNLAGKYFTLNTAFNQKQYYFWYTVNGVGTDPAVSGHTGVVINITLNSSANTVATVTNSVLDLHEFTSSVSGNVITSINTNYGPALAGTAGTSGFTVTQIQIGALDVLLSDIVSPSQAVDETARSLVRIINKNKTENVYAYYLSGATDVPGKFLLEARTLNAAPYYISTNNTDTGSSFNPDLSPLVTISSVSTGNPATMLVTTSTNHGLINQDFVVISGSNSIPTIDGYRQITYVSPTTFRVNVTITTAGTTGGLTKSTDAAITSNDDKPNRIFFSKLNQPEAVPLLNYFDVGAMDKAILRIFPLRDTLFILKEDGLFRISGEQAPFTLSLFDSSCVLLAPDSVSVSNNIIYAWTTQGIVSLSESGVGNPPVSRPIDTEILKVSSNSYTSFKTATWGLGYDSDNSYTVYTISQSSDTVSTIAYRYSNLTNSWTSFDISKNCGVINFIDDTLYLGPTDLNNVEKERKDFSRTDYSDRQYNVNLGSSNYFGTQMRISDVSNVQVGDVLVQEQTITPYTFDMLLKKIDIDPGFSTHDYEQTLKPASGSDLRLSLVALAAKLDADPSISNPIFSSSISSKSGSITGISPSNPTILTSTNHGLITGRVVLIASSNSSPIIDNIYPVTVIDANTFSIPVAVVSPGTSAVFSTLDSNFADMEVCFNEVITLLNADDGPSYSNYSIITDMTTVEAIVTYVNTTTKYVTVNLALPFIVGPLINYKAIETKVTYAPNTFQDPLTFKHFRELTMMFLSKAFTNATVSVATDLFPQLVPIPLPGDGNGIFGYADFGNQFFGGASHPVPFRSYIPRQCQRCRYIVMQFTHKIAREQYGITGVTLTGEVYSTRAYR